jgi:hypothetical protein
VGTPPRKEIAESDLACSSLQEVIDKVCEGLNQLEDDPEQLRSMISFPRLRNVS